MFNSDALASQSRDHFPGTFFPFVQQTQERWKRCVFLSSPSSWKATTEGTNVTFTRIVSYIFKADTYMSILRGQPPSIYWDELDISLPQTFAQSNADGLDVYYKRMPYEPTDRPDYKSLALATCSTQNTPSVLLVEDILLGLCQLYQMVWRCNQLCCQDTMDTHPTADVSESLLSQLDSWKSQLDKIVVLCITQAQQDSLELPLRAYCGFEDESEPGWKMLVLERVQSLSREASMLYHLLSLQIHISKHSKLSELLLSDSGMASIENGIQLDWVSGWRQSKDARKILAHSVAITRTLELALLEEKPRDRFMPSPITSLAFSISRNVLRIWSASPEGACTCNRQEIHTDLDLNSSGLYRGSELHEWFENGGPPQVSGSPFCKCAGEMWFMRVEPLL